MKSIVVQEEQSDQWLARGFLLEEGFTPIVDLKNSLFHHSSTQNQVCGSYCSEIPWRRTPKIEDYPKISWVSNNDLRKNPLLRLQSNLPTPHRQTPLKRIPLKLSTISLEPQIFLPKNWQPTKYIKNYQIFDWRFSEDI